MSALKLMFAATGQIDEEVEEVKTRILDLEENISLSPGEYNYVGARVIKKVFQIGKERSYNMKKEQKVELFRALNRESAAITGVRTRNQLKQKYFDDVIDFIDDWEPSKATSVVVKQLELELEI
ncbi:ORF6C domain-containing protein [Carnobacterium sp. TMP28]|uniref:ORF6C domain-containing protein n=1 Tax=Carnobacterium sp. TMP28 TaxID=3397060 RepID=UPI0039DFA751